MTIGHPELLRDLALYLGFLWLPEYRVYKHHREFNQTYYKVVVCLLDDPEWLDVVAHTCEAYGSTVEIAVHQCSTPTPELCRDTM